MFSIKTTKAQPRRRRPGPRFGGPLASHLEQLLFCFFFFFLLYDSVSSLSFFELLE
jgi:hypothetical protein